MSIDHHEGGDEVVELPGLHRDTSTKISEKEAGILMHGRKEATKAARR